MAGGSAMPGGAAMGGVPQGFTGAATQLPSWTTMQQAAMPQSSGTDWAALMGGMQPQTTPTAPLPNGDKPGAIVTAPTNPTPATDITMQSARGELYKPEIPPPAAWTPDIPKQTRPKAATKPKYTLLGNYNTGPSGGGYAARDTWGGDVYKSDKGKYFWDKEGKYAIPDDVRQRLIGLK